MILSYYRGCEYLVTFANNFYSSHGIVHDLPQLYQNPSASKLLETLRLLAPSTPSNFSSTTRRQVEPLGVPRYLTSIISSPLAWLESDVQREEIYNLASHVLASRSGRTAMPALTRSYTIDGSEICTGQIESSGDLAMPPYFQVPGLVQSQKWVNTSS